MSATGDRRRRFLLALLGLTLACGRAPPRPAPKHDVTVFAAASLRESFALLGKKLEELHPGTQVVLSFAGSQALRAQIQHGAPADVFASADQRHMQALVTDQRVLLPQLFAKNELCVVVSRAKASELRGLEALPTAERIVLGAPEVPIGVYTAQMLDKASRELGGDFRARVEAHVVSREPDVRQVLAKVALGEVDAGVVYRTDALTQKDKVLVIAIPAVFNVLAEYPVAVTTSAPEPELGRAFVTLLLSAVGQEILAKQGFLPVGPGTALP